VVKVIRQVGDHVAAAQGLFLGRRLAELHEALARAIVEALVDHVALRTVHAGNDRPGRVIVWGHLLAGAPGRGIERKAVVGVLAQAVDAAVGAQRELLLREEVGPACQGGQQPADLVEVGIGDAALFDLPGLVDQAPHGRGALLMQGHLLLRLGTV
jgi:hypothetical protein